MEVKNKTEVLGKLCKTKVLEFSERLNIKRNRRYINVYKLRVCLDKIFIE